MLACNGGEGNKDGKVDGAVAIEDGADNFLDMFLLVIGRGGGDIVWLWFLGGGAIAAGGMGKGECCGFTESECLYFCNCFLMYLGIEKHNLCCS